MSRQAIFFVNGSRILIEDRLSDSATGFQSMPLVLRDPSEHHGEEISVRGSRSSERSSSETEVMETRGPRVCQFVFAINSGEHGREHNEISLC
jgi:hypothetical protein